MTLIDVVSKVAEFRQGTRGPVQVTMSPSAFEKFESNLKPLGIAPRDGKYRRLMGCQTIACKPEQTEPIVVSACRW